MATTIQQIETPKRARALDTSSGWQEVGLELITDGGFTDGANWSTGTGWTDTGGFGDWDTDAVGGNDRIYQDIPTLVVGKYYKLVFTISNSTSGRQLVRLLGGDALQDVTYANDGTTFAAGGITHIDDVTAKGYGTYVNGTHTLIFAATQASDQFNFYANDTYSDFRVDDISLKEVRYFPNNNHGQIYSGRALEFDGVMDYLDLGVDTTFIDFSAETTQVNRAWTVAAWINIDSLDAGRIQNIIGRSGTISSSYISIAQTTKKLIINDEGGGGYRSSNTALNINTWYRVAWVFDGDTTVTFYLNGVADGTGEIDNTGDNADLSMRYIGARVGGDASAGTERLFGGKMADLQLWQGAWTADDASYDYLNPESLALNRGGTSLTNSNLLAWYPMQDGHRGQQSCVLDASNTGLSTSNVITPNLSDNGDYDGNDDSNWTLGTTAEWTVTTNTSSSFGATTNSNIDGTAHAYFYISSNNSGMSEHLPIGKYKITGTLSTTGTLPNISSTPKLRWYGTGSTYIDNDLSVGDFEVYGNITSVNGNPYFRFLTETEGHNFTLSNVKVTPINDKNPATTVFYGDELINTANDQAFGGAGNWIAYGTDSAISVNSNVAGKLELTTDGGGGVQGAQLPIVHVGNGSTTSIVVGRTYRVTARIDDVGTADADARYEFFLGGGYGRVKATDGSPSNGSIDTTEQEYYVDIIPINTTSALVFAKTASTNDAATVVTLDGVSVKEVGTASGWTDVDQQLHIPQTALQSYNELLWMQGQEENGTETDNVPITIGSDVWNPASNNVPNAGKTALDWNTISAWVFFTEDSFNDTAFLYRVAGGDPNLYMVVQDPDIKIGLNTGSGEVVGASYPQSSIVNKWNHIVFAWKPISHIELYGGNVNEMAFGTINGSGVSTGTATAVIDDTDATGSADLTQVNVESVPSAMVVNSRLKYMKGTTRPSGDQGSGVANQDCAIITNIDGNTITFNDAIRFEDDETITVDVYDTDNFDSHVRLWINGEKLPVTQVSNYHSGNIATSTQDDLEVGDSETNTTAYSHQGIITEISAWNKDLSTSEVEELYNDGKPLDALTHSALTNLKGYWRNNGLNTWKDLVQSNNGTPSSTCSETILIPQGVDSSRDSQGFIMNRQRDTSSLNFARNNDTSNHTGPGVEARYTRDGVVDSQFGNGLGDFTVEFWFKTNQILSSSGSVLYQSAGYSAPNWTGIDIHLNNAGNVRVSMYTGSSSTSVLWADSDNPSVGGSTDENYNDGNWHHLAFVVDRSAKATLIIDKIVECIYTTNVTDNTTVVCFNGSQRVGSSTSAFQTGATTNRPAFDGQIDGLKIYNDLLTFDTDGSIYEGETITSGEVLRNYNATKGNHRN